MPIPTRLNLAGHRPNLPMTSLYRQVAEQQMRNPAPVEGAPQHPFQPFPTGGSPDMRDELRFAMPQEQGGMMSAQAAPRTPPQEGAAPPMSEARAPRPAPTAPEGPRQNVPIPEGMSPPMAGGEPPRPSMASAPMAQDEAARRPNQTPRQLYMPEPEPAPQEGGIGSMRASVPDPSDDPDEADAKVENLAKQVMAPKPERKPGGDPPKPGKKPEAPEGEQDTPEWAMPLLAMGLSMMASDNPNFFGALGEGGIAALQDYAKRKQSDREDERYQRKEGREERRLDMAEQRAQQQAENEAARLGISMEELALRQQQAASLDAQRNQSNWDTIGRDTDGNLIQVDQFGNQRTFEGVQPLRRGGSDTRAFDLTLKNITDVAREEANMQFPQPQMGMPDQNAEKRQQFYQDRVRQYAAQAGVDLPQQQQPQAQYVFDPASGKLIPKGS